MTTIVASRIARYSPCVEATAWLNARRSPYHAWQACERGDWMLWIAARIDVDRRLLVLAACDCAEVALVHVPAGEKRPAEALRVARAWATGDETVSLDGVRMAADAANAANAVYAAADAAYAANAANAVYAAANAADAVANAAYAAANAADAVANAAYAARRETYAKCADLVRARIPWSEVRRAMKEAGV